MAASMAWYGHISQSLSKNNLTKLSSSPLNVATSGFVQGTNVDLELNLPIRAVHFAHRLALGLETMASYGMQHGVSAEVDHLSFPCRLFVNSDTNSPKPIDPSLPAPSILSGKTSRTAEQLLKFFFLAFALPLVF
ncbi:hypothetical protein ACFX13_004499 [Malus domestica]